MSSRRGYFQEKESRTDKLIDIFAHTKRGFIMVPESLEIELRWVYRHEANEKTEVMINSPPVPTPHKVDKKRNAITL